MNLKFTAEAFDFAGQTLQRQNGREIATSTVEKLTYILTSKKTIRTLPKSFVFKKTEQNIYRNTRAAADLISGGIPSVSFHTNDKNTVPVGNWLFTAIAAEYLLENAQELLSKRDVQVCKTELHLLFYLFKQRCRREADKLLSFEDQHAQIKAIIGKNLTDSWEYLIKDFTVAYRQDVFGKAIENTTIKILQIFEKIGQPADFLVLPSPITQYWAEERISLKEKSKEEVDEEKVKEENITHILNPKTFLTPREERPFLFAILDLT